MRDNLWMFDIVVDFWPDIIVIDVGLQDLLRYMEEDDKEYVEGVFSIYANIFKRMALCDAIVVACKLNNAKQLFSKQETFEKRKKIFNELLHVLGQKDKSIIMAWKHSHHKITSMHPTVSSDGINIDTVTGIQLYICSVRQAIISAFHSLK